MDVTPTSTAEDLSDTVEYKSHYTENHRADGICDNISNNSMQTYSSSPMEEEEEEEEEESKFARVEAGGGTLAIPGHSVSVSSISRTVGININSSELQRRTEYGSN